MGMRPLNSHLPYFSMGEFPIIQPNASPATSPPRLSELRTGSRYILHTQPQCMRLIIKPIVVPWCSGQVCGLITHRGCEFESCTCQNENTTSEEGNGGPPHKIHFSRKNSELISGCCYARSQECHASNQWSTKSAIQGISACKAYKADLVGSSNQWRHSWVDPITRKQHWRCRAVHEYCFSKKRTWIFTNQHRNAPF